MYWSKRDQGEDGEFTIGAHTAAALDKIWKVEREGAWLLDSHFGILEATWYLLAASSSINAFSL